MNGLRTWIGLTLIAVLAACAQTPPPAKPQPATPAAAPAPAPLKESFLLLPDRNGIVGQITIMANGQQQVLNMASQGTSLDIATKTIAPPTIWSDERIEEEFEDALKNEPLPPKTYNLQFDTQANTLATNSRPVLTAIAADARARPSYHVIIAGHAVGHGTKEQNKRLSLKWAQLARQELVRLNLKSGDMTVEGYGESPSLMPGVGAGAVLDGRVEVTVQ